MPTFGLVGDAYVHLQIEAGDPGEALQEGQLMDPESWTPEGEIRDITVVTMDGESVEDPGLTPAALTFDIWHSQYHGGPIAEAIDLGKAILIVEDIEAAGMAVGRQMSVWYTPHNYPGLCLTSKWTLEQVADTLGFWGRTNTIPGAPMEGPWYA